MRRTKREIIAAEASDDEDMLTAKSILLRRQREEYAKFSKEAGLLTQNERTQVYGFGKSVAQKARWKAQKALDNGDGSGIMNIEIDEFVPCLKDSKTGTILATEAKILPKSKYGRYTFANGWNLDWKDIPDNEDVFGVYLKDDAEPQGLIAIRRDRGGIFVSHVSTAPQNNKQLNNGYQKYIGVGGHLFAIAVEESVKAGNKTGCVYGFAANEDVLRHYVNKLGAIHFPIAHEFQFIIDGDAAQNIIDTYNFESG